MFAVYQRCSTREHPSLTSLRQTKASWSKLSEKRSPTKREKGLPLFSRKTPLVKSSTSAASGICFHSRLLPCPTFLDLNKKLSWTFVSKGSGQQWKQHGLKQDPSISGWREKKKNSGDFPLPSGDTCLVIPADLPQKTSGFNSLYLDYRVAVDVASKGKGACSRSGVRCSDRQRLSLKKCQNNQLDQT